MKKKYSKNQFYKKLEMQNLNNPALIIARLEAMLIAMNALQESFLVMSAATQQLHEIKADIQHMKEHGVPREKPKTWVIHSGENRMSPEQIAENEALLWQLKQYSKEYKPSKIS